MRMAGTGIDIIDIIFNAIISTGQIAVDDIWHFD